MRTKTVLCMGHLAESCFTSGTYASGHIVLVDDFADLLFEYDAGDIVVKYARQQPRAIDAIKNFVLQLWTNHSSFWPEDAGPQAAVLRERRMIRIAEALLEYSTRPREKTLVFIDQRKRGELVAALELDGFELRGSQIVRNEENTFDVPEQEGVFLALYRSLGLQQLTQATKELQDVDDHYVSNKWGDSIKHARDLMEVSLLAVAQAFSRHVRATLNAQATTQPRVVRDELERMGLISASEKKFLASLYSLLSEQGGHPNMSEAESARICRQYALSALHFVLLRYQSLVASQGHKDDR